MEENREGSLVLVLIGSRALGVWQWSSAMVGARSLHGGHVGISANTWRAAEWPAWETIVGLFQAEFGHGPKNKFAKLGLPYNFD